MSVSILGVSLGASVIEAWPEHEEAGSAVAEVVTGEAVVLEVPCARFPSRLLALALDLLIQGILLFVLFLIVGLAVTSGGANRATAGAIALTLTIAIIVGYPVLWGALAPGGPPGQFPLGRRAGRGARRPHRVARARGGGRRAVGVH